jgi:hypothetical protein
MGPGWGAVRYCVLAGTTATTSPTDYRAQIKKGKNKRKISLYYYFLKQMVLIAKEIN